MSRVPCSWWARIRFALGMRLMIFIHGELSAAWLMVNAVQHSQVSSPQPKIRPSRLYVDGITKPNVFVRMVHGCPIELGLNEWASFI